MKPINTGIASFGMSGAIFHAPLLHVHPKFNIKQILERTKNNSSEKYNYSKIARKYETLINDRSIELIVVNTPDHLHYDMVKTALLARKHVIVEKPFLLNSEKGEELIQLSIDKNLILSVFHNRRWDGDFLTVKKVIESGQCGRIVEYIAQYDRFRNFIRKSWKENPEYGTSTLFNLGSHLIDQTLTLFGLPKEVNADIASNRTNAVVDDYFHLRMEYNDFRAILKGSYLVCEPGPRYMLHGTEGSYVKYGTDPQEAALNNGMIPNTPDWGYDPKENWGILHIYNNGKPERNKIETERGNYLAYYDNIYSAIREGKPLNVTAEQGLNVIKIIEAAKLSNLQKRNISL